MNETITTLARLDQAAHMLAEIHDAKELVEVINLAEAAKAYAKAIGLGLAAQNHAAEIHLRAQRQLGAVLAELSRESGGDRRSAEFQISTRGDLKSEYKATLEATGTTYQQAQRVQAIASVPEPVFEEHLATVRAEAAEITSAGVLRVAQQIKRQENYNAKHAAPPLAGKYSVIYADPPWAYDNSGFDQSAAAHYPTMTIDQLCAMPVAELADEPCALYMWATVPLLPDALRVLQAWGFEYKSHRVWIKDKAPGIGWWLHTRHELLLIGTRNGNAHPLERLQSVVECPASRHSRKPDVFRQEIERCHEGKRIELFAREAFKGWEAWGNESL